MSKNFFSQFESLMNSTILEFCGRISKKYGGGEITQENLYNMWLNVNSNETVVKSAPKDSTPSVVVKPKSPPPVSEKSAEITKEKVLDPSTTKELLVAMCKAKGLTCSGKKEDLIKRLVDCLSTNSSPPSTSSSSSVTSTPSVIVKKSPPKAKKEEPTVIKEVKSTTGATPLSIRKNSFGNYEHGLTHLIFNKETLVCGLQNPDGTVSKLTDAEIELCKKYKFKYVTPENLNTNKGGDDVKIEELEEDNGDEELDEEDILEEELEEDDDEPAEDEN